MAADGVRRRRSDGAAAVEFALVVIPVLVLVFGLIQYGLYFWSLQGGSDVARSAARLAAVGKPASCSEFRAEIQSQIDALAGAGATDTIERTYSTATPGEVAVGDRVKVVVEFQSIDLHFPFVPFIDHGRVTAKAETRVEYVPSQPEACS